MASVAEKVDKLKLLGNQALQSNKPNDAIKLYTEAIELDPKNHVLYSNRSACHAKLGNYEDALDDAEQTIELKGDWPKGYSRKGAALSFLNRYEEAAMCYETGLKLEPGNNQMKQGLEEAKSHLTGPAGSQPLMNPFADPLIIPKLESDPRTKDLMKQPDFRLILEELRKNPNSLASRLNDQRVMTALSVLLGIDLSNTEIRTESRDEPRGSSSRQTPSPPTKPSSAKKSETKSCSKSMDVDMTDDQKKAAEFKELGNAAYKRKEFEPALENYGKALKLDPTNMTYGSNIAAVYFEKGEFKKCIEECEKAVAVGREHRADYKLIAKCLARAGNAYAKMDDLENALTFLNKSLVEHRAPDIVKRANAIDKEIKARAAKALFDPEKSAQEKEQGNACFQKGDYPTALSHYTSAIKHNPDDPKLYSNRAACYTKLLEFQLALRDCDECIKKDSKFVKGYLRKAACLVALKENEKAADAYRAALDIDPTCEEAQVGYRKCLASTDDPEAMRRRALEDPEVQKILSDPAMQLILQQMQKDPTALQEHLKNPDIAAKIEKLLEAGVIGIR